MLKEPAQQAALGEALALCRQLAVSYAGLTLTLDMFPQVRLLAGLLVGQGVLGHVGRVGR